MKRLLFLLAVTAAAIAVPSTALAARGVALTKDQARHAVVVDRCHTDQVPGLGQERRDLLGRQLRHGAS